MKTIVTLSAQQGSGPGRTAEKLFEMMRSTDKSYDQLQETILAGRLNVIERTQYASAAAAAASWLR